MNEFIASLDPFLKALYFIAIPCSVIFLLQTILTFVGMDGHDIADADFDGNLDTEHTPFQLFSFRNLINFLLGFSWGTITFYHSFQQKWVAIVLGVVIGLSLLALFFLILKNMYKLAQDNTMNINNAVGKTGQVYLTIPAAKSGNGKVHIAIQGSLRELEAVTEQEQPIATGSNIKVIGIINNSILLVEKI